MFFLSSFVSMLKLMYLAKVSTTSVQNALTFVGMEDLAAEYRPEVRA